MESREMERDRYMIYNEMFNRAHELMKMIRKRLERDHAKIYCIEVYVGIEETRQYSVYVEYVRNGFYKYINGVLMTEDDIKKSELL